MSRLLIFAFLLFTPLIVIGQERVTDIQYNKGNGQYRGWYEYEEKMYFSISHQSVHRVFQIENDSLELVFEFKMSNPKASTYNYGFQDDYYFIQNRDQIVLFFLKDHSHNVHNLSENDIYRSSDYFIFSYYGSDFNDNFTSKAITKDGHLYHQNPYQKPERLIYRDYKTGKRDTLIAGYLRDSVRYSMVVDSFLILGLKDQDPTYTNLWLYNLKTSEKQLIDKKVYYFSTRDRYKDEFTDLIYHDHKNDTLFHYSFDKGKSILYAERDTNQYISDYRRNIGKPGYQIIVYKGFDKYKVIILNEEFEVTEESEFTFHETVDKIIDLEDHILILGYRNQHVYDKMSKNISKVEIFPHGNSNNRSFTTDSFYYKRTDNSLHKLYIYDIYNNKLDSVRFPDLDMKIESRVQIGNAIYIPAYGDSLFYQQFIKIKGGKVTRISYKANVFSSGMGEFNKNQLRVVDNKLYLLTNEGLLKYHNGAFINFIDLSFIKCFASYNDLFILLRGGLPLVYTMNINDTLGINTIHIDTVENTTLFSTPFLDCAGLYKSSNKLIFDETRTVGVPIEYNSTTKKAKYLDSYIKRYYSMIIKSIENNRLLFAYQDSIGNDHITTYNTVTSESFIPTKYINELNPINYYYSDKLYASVINNNAFETYTVNLTNGSYTFYHSIEFDEIYETYTRPNTSNHYQTNIIYKKDGVFYFSFFNTASNSFNEIELNIESDSIKNAYVDFNNKYSGIDNLFIHGDNDKGHLIYNLYNSPIVLTFDMNNHNIRAGDPREILKVEDKYIINIGAVDPKIYIYKEKQSSLIQIDPLRENKEIDFIPDSKTDESFIAVIPTESEGEEFWEYKDEKFSPLTSINPGYYGCDPSSFVKYNNSIFFIAYNIIHGYQVYKYELPESSITPGNQSKSELQFSIYPNPGTSNIYIYCKKEVNTYEIFDLTGKLIQEDQFNNYPFSHKIDISRLPASNYIIKLRSKNGEVGAQLFTKPE